MLQLLSQFPEKHNDPAVKIGVETILSLWEQRKERHPYLFAMGTDFSKLKAPLIWYDILHVTNVLTQISWTLEDQRLQERPSCNNSHQETLNFSVKTKNTSLGREKPK
jgi:hypothetical protein